MVLNDPTKAFDQRPVLRNGVRGFTELFDKLFQDTGFTITNTVFDTDNVLIFDVRGLYAFFIQLDNTTGTVALDYKIDFITLETSTPETVPAVALFPLVIEKQVAIGAWSNATLDGADNISEFIRATPKITFIKISLKLAAAGSTTVKGVISAI